MSSKFIEISFVAPELTRQNICQMLFCLNVIYGLFVHYMSIKEMKDKNVRTIAIVGLFLHRISIGLIYKIAMLIVGALIYIVVSISLMSTKWKCGEILGSEIHLLKLYTPADQINDNRYSDTAASLLALGIMSIMSSFFWLPLCGIIR